METYVRTRVWSPVSTYVVVLPQPQVKEVGSTYIDNFLNSSFRLEWKTRLHGIVRFRRDTVKTEFFHPNGVYSNKQSRMKLFSHSLVFLKK